MKAVKLSVIALGVTLVASWTCALGQGALADQKKAQNKLLAYRAARADAIRKLAERIQGLRITSETTVKDFVTQSDTIKTGVYAFLSGMKEVDKPQYMEDGTCSVTLEVALGDVIVSLEQIYKASYKGEKIRIDDFKKMTVTNEIKLLRETGSGAPRPEVPEGEVQPVSAGASVDSIGLTGKAKAYWMAHVTGQGRLMALRAARVDGMRRLGERINGLMISSKTSVRDFVAESDDIRVDMRTFLQGAREASVMYHDDEPIAEVEMEVTLRTIYASLKSWGETHYKGNQIKMSRFDELTTEAKDTIIKETGSGVPPQTMLKDVAVEVIAAAQRQNPDWTGRTMTAVGNGAVDTANENKAQAKLMAFRAAELDARRKLAEQLEGLMITSNTKVRDFVTQNDDIRTAMLTFQQGAGVVEGSQKLMEDGTAQVTVEISLEPLWKTITYYEKKLSLTIK